MARLFNNSEIVQMCHILAEQEQLKVSVKESLKAGFVTAFGAISGGLLGGPIGIAIGGTLASVTAAWCSKNKFRSVVDILRNDLTPSQQQKLIKHMSNVLAEIKPEDYVSLITLVLTSTSMKEMVIKEIGLFLLKELNLKMVQ